MNPERLVACLLAALPGCLAATPPGAFFSTSPSGARVRVDGHDTGFVTPCQVDLDGEERVRVELELAGYTPASIVLAPSSATEVIGWSHGHAYPTGSLRLALFVPGADLFLPFRPDQGHHPQRVHVRLQPVAE
jgi:hypothetical protein